jgi:hypothetical protein
MNVPETIISTCWIHPDRPSSADFPAVCGECQAEAWRWARQVGLAGHSGWLHSWLRDVAGVVHPPVESHLEETS